VFYYYTTFKRDFGVTVEVVPFCPRHAFNHTDRKFAGLNGFYDKVMRASWLAGAKAFARALSVATDAKMTSSRRLITRTTVVYREFAPQDYIPSPDHLPTQIKVGDTSYGVMKLGYFDMSVAGADGKTVENPIGVMRARVFGDLTLEGNEPMVFDMRPGQAQGHCQPCSDRAVLSLSQLVIE
jgi:hypothetical protein